jgi:general nucleoside transport system permease protein
MNEIQITAYIAGGVRLALPVLFAAVGELVSERAGVLNLSLEGMMLSGAFGASVATAATGSAVVGVCAGMLVALLFAACQAFLTVKAGANQLVVGIAANAFALGFTSFAARHLLGSAGDRLAGFDKCQIPLLSRLPLIGEGLFGQSSLGYVGLLLVAFTLFVLKRTGWGLAVTAVGEDAQAADRAGTPVLLVRTLAILWTGAMAGFGGAFIALADVHAFTQNMTAGRGYLAIVAVIAGAWIGPRVVVACVVFGAATALQFQATALGIHVPVALLVMSPYLLALLAVAGLVGRQRPPRNLTLPFQR